MQQAETIIYKTETNFKLIANDLPSSYKQTLYLTDEFNLFIHLESNDDHFVLYYQYESNPLPFILTLINETKLVLDCVLPIIYFSASGQLLIDLQLQLDLTLQDYQSINNQVKHSPLQLQYL